MLPQTQNAVYIFLGHAPCLLASLKYKLQQTNNNFKRSYQNAQAGGVEGWGEIDDSAPGRVDGEGGDSHVSCSAQQVPDKSRPASHPTRGTVLPVAHNIKVKGETHVLCEFL